eukprot:m51a1_g5938 hypothetical protein (235) ;mRNA; r:110299-111072
MAAIGALLVAVVVVGRLAANCVIVADTATHEAVVVDPGDDADRILARLASPDLAGTRVVALVLTHAHFDHAGAAPALQRALPGRPPLLSHASDVPLFPGLHDQCRSFGCPLKASAFPREPDGFVADGGSVLGPAEKETRSRALAAGRVVHVPGHSPGSVALHWPTERLVLSGDTLFAGGGVGRTDLQGGDAGALQRSVARLLRLPADTAVIPGHGQRTTIKRERAAHARTARDL